MAMLANVHLAGDDNDDDLYSGFGTEEVAPELQTEDLEFDEGFQVILRTIRNFTISHWHYNFSLLQHLTKCGKLQLLLSNLK